MTLHDLSQALSGQMLTPLGHCSHEGGTLVLIGPDEPHFWAHFTQSPEYVDTQPDALDRWSTRVLSALTKQVGGQVFFPFGGEPFHPFYTWALNTGQFFASPIGFLVHHERGLFASFRGAILLPTIIPQKSAISPCRTCHAPCKTACPVGAFHTGYNVGGCKSHIRSTKGADCITQGCRARRACPIHHGNRLPAQAQFHMEAFQ